MSLSNGSIGLAKLSFEVCGPPSTTWQSSDGEDEINARLLLTGFQVPPRDLPRDITLELARIFDL